MASLAELHAALVALAQGDKTAKLYFYFTEPGEMRQQSGFLFVDRGQKCYVSLAGLDSESALVRIPRLALSKVASLPAMRVDPAIAATQAFALASVIDRLDPSHQPALEPSPVLLPPAAEPAPLPAAAEAPPPASPEPAEPHVFYSHVALQKDVLDVLEGIYGIGVAKKLESIANTSPPHQYPAEFVAKCRQHAAVMLGDRKAAELFRAIEEKVAGHLH